MDSRTVDDDDDDYGDDNSLMLQEPENSLSQNLEGNKRNKLEYVSIVQDASKLWGLF